MTTGYDAATLPIAEAVDAISLRKLTEQYKHYSRIFNDREQHQPLRNRREPQAIRLCFSNTQLEYIALDRLEKETVQDMTNEDLANWIEEQIGSIAGMAAHDIIAVEKELAKGLVMDTNLKYLEQRIDSLTYNLRVLRY